jgi:hypothetical protein
MDLNIGQSTVIPPPARSNAQGGAAQSTASPGNASAGRADAQAQLNISIVQASLSVSISAKNQPLALLFKSALDEINDILKPTLGANAIQNAVGQDNTPEGTAARIVSLSTGFFQAYQQQHPEMSQPDALKNFMAAIRSGFERGLNEAKDILQGLQVLSGDIAENIDRTSELVRRGYADFEAANAA